MNERGNGWRHQYGRAALFRFLPTSPWQAGPEEAGEALEGPNVRTTPPAKTQLHKGGEK